MNLYETIVILNAELSDEAITEAIEKIKDQITSGGGEILKADAWGKQRMAYAINKHIRGFYLLLVYNAPGELIQKLETYFKITDSVVKQMIVKLEKKQKAAVLRKFEEQAAKEAAAAAAPAETAAEDAPATETAAQDTPATEAAPEDAPSEKTTTDAAPAIGATTEKASAEKATPEEATPEKATTENV